MSDNNTTPKVQTNQLSKTRSLEEQVKQANYFKPINSGEITKSLTQTIAQANYFAPKPATPVIPTPSQPAPVPVTPLPSTNKN